MSMGNKKPISVVNALGDGVGALALTPPCNTHLLLLEVRIENNAGAIASDVEAGLSEPHNLHHGLLLGSCKEYF